MPFIIAVLWLYLSAPAGAVSIDSYWPSEMCSNCHKGIYDQHIQSMHAKAYTNEVFQAQYYKEVLPLVREEESLAAEARGCVACHSPISFLASGSTIVAREMVNQKMSGVTCDFCHTMQGYRDDRPGNGNYIARPGEQKLGPLIYKSSLAWHHAYSDLHTRSEFCAVCHNQVNRHGIEIKSTYTEWKESPYNKQGIQCQDCHMNEQGFLTLGSPVYESGEAARTPLAQTPYRPKLFTHRFPGAHSKSQIRGAMKLEIKVRGKTASPGDQITIDVFIDNTRTGHKMPSGSADLRLLWLELKAYMINDKSMTAMPVDGRGDSAAVDTGDDRAILLENNIPQGSRLYRAVFLDKAGKQTLASYTAAKIAADNRLNAAEIRQETYRFKVPENAGHELYLFADLNYLPYPMAFAKKLGLPEPDKIVITSTKKMIALQ